MTLLNLQERLPAANDEFKEKAKANVLLLFLDEKKQKSSDISLAVSIIFDTR